MTAYVDPRFRPTLWPGTPVPTPELEPVAGAHVDGDWIVWDVPNLRRERSTVALPEDFYLRELMELDPADLNTVANWMGSYGMFCGHGAGLASANWDIEAQEQVTRLAETEHPERTGWSIHGGLVSLYVREAQQAVTTWLACRRDGGLDALVEPEVNEMRLAAIRSENSHRDEEFPRSLEHLRELELWDRLTQLKSSLQAALNVFSVGIGSLTDRYPTIHSVAFLQMYNHMAENATVRQCANETCCRSFVRQRGRAEYGQNRTSGIKYCTRECARAQAQRELRRRRKQQASAERPA
ncbi:hypothetical protein [Streptomyces sp. NPDC056255]|uniref:hypothetical protein n=1 Tax=Streptomyces sp. NPDC056255 TaxID=3345764 RepID=UPI0035DC3EAF